MRMSEKSVPGVPLMMNYDMHADYDFVDISASGYIIVKEVQLPKFSHPLALLLALPLETRLSSRNP